MTLTLSHTHIVGLNESLGGASTKTDVQSIQSHLGVVLRAIHGWANTMHTATLNPEAHQRTVATSSCPSRSFNILVVEDESIVALDLMATLRRLGYGVAGHALSGEEAIETCRDSRPDLVLMDMRLQGSIDGIEATAHIRAHFGIPVVFLTAFSDEDTRQRAAEVGMAGYLRKPVSVGQLKKAINDVLYPQSGN